MSLYHIVAIALLISAIYEQIKRKTPQKLFKCLFVILSIMLIFRYGQGTDYFGYYFNYRNVPAGKEIAELRNIIIHGEIGWRFLCSWSKQFGLSFETFVMLVSVFEAVMLWRFIQQYCIFKILALLLAYHTLYLTYMFSALRQGLVTMAFLGVLLNWFFQKKYAHYIVGTLICATIHTISFLFFIAFLVPLLYKISEKKMLIWTFVSWGIGLGFSLNYVQNLLKKVLPAGAVYYMHSTNFTIAALERVISFFMVFYFYQLYLIKTKKSPEQKIMFFMRLYNIGIMLYGMVLWNSLLASRCSFAFKILEICIISSVLSKIGKSREVLFTFCIMLSIIMYIKNIDSYLNENQYREKYNTIWTYPYISIFEKDNITKYKFISYTYLLE